jgi:hypothetical protein
MKKYGLWEVHAISTKEVLHGHGKGPAAQQADEAVCASA